MERLPGDPVCRRRPRARSRQDRVLSSPRRIVLLRHGRTADNHRGVMQGQLDTPLDEVGRAQAVAVATALAAAEPSQLVSSDLARARDTATALAGSLGLVVRLDERLRELHLGTWQGKTADEVMAAHPEEYAAWRSGSDVARGGGETYAEAGERAAAALNEALADVPAGGTLLAVTHGGTARAALGRLLDLPLAQWAALAPLGNTCWSVLVEADRGWRLERHNTGLGPLVGPATGAHDLGSRPVGGGSSSPDVEPGR
ncbi:MAG TPA: histidine phosphatase family protein [Mycobacteriales bacterium]|nr:histidine phosphatase family protein [Mycobacteriales bacterium]